MHDTIALIEGDNEHGVEVDPPDAIVDFLESDGLIMFDIVDGLLWIGEAFVWLGRRIARFVAGRPRDHG